MLVGRIQPSRCGRVLLGCGLCLALASGCSADPGPFLQAEPGLPTPAPGFSPPAAAPAPVAPAPPPTPPTATPRLSVAASAPAEPEIAAPLADEEALEARPTEVPLLFAAAREVFVYERPSPTAKKLGYLRAGARVTRSREAVSQEGCAAGFYRVAPLGFVCVGN